MVAISFSIMKEKLLDGSKAQTIRLVKPLRLKQLSKAKNLEIYWKQRDPKESEKLFDAELIDLTPIKFFERMSLETMLDITEADGFNGSPGKLIGFLIKAHGEKAVKTETFTIIRFKKKERV